MSKLLNVYHRLPHWCQGLAATAHGYRLKRWRYGRNTASLIDELIRRESWTREEMRRWQDQRLDYVLERAATRVPYYREYWASMGGSRKRWRYLDNWPLLDKEDVRRTPERFVADDCNIHKMYHEHTSGTTGKPLDLWWSADTVRLWYAMFEVRWRLWYGVSRSDRWAILGGQLVTPVGRHRPPFWVWNAALRQLYMSSYHLSPGKIGSYLDALVSHRIVYLWGYSSSLHSLAEEALHLGRRDVRMNAAIANAEPVLPHQREAVREAFGCEMRETYGMAEIVTAASECDQGRLHVWPDVGIIEVTENGVNVAPDEPGELVCTGLVNADMPLIRYRLGDRGTLAHDNSACGCGRHWTYLKSVEGRCDDMLITRDGRRIGRLDPVFKSRLPIREAQIIQDTLDLVRVRFVPAPEYTSGAGEAIVNRLRERMGNIDVRLEPVERIERTSNGKLRAVVCHIPRHDFDESLLRHPPFSQ